ncbi:MAG: NAD(P)(+) transhydrogenase (Re/Si-specific) subunit alpha, partial [Caldithrix sp.]|nr:NAD(P)(+) transhydrogenase (Re/Si-specific) subunit alpha [Caldithrix sp.]
MKIGIPKEVTSGETRVAIIPSQVGVLTKSDHEVLVEKDAGIRAAFSDKQYEEAGARIIAATDELYQQADIILKVQPPTRNKEIDKHEVDWLQ